MFFGKKRKQKKRSFFRLSRIPRPSFSVGQEARQGIWILVIIMSGIALTLSFSGKAGAFGEIANKICIQLFGNGKWAVPIILSLTVISLSGKDKHYFNSANLFGLFLFLTGFSSLLYFFNPEAGGGLLGKTTVEWLLPFVGPGVAAALLSTGIIISLLLLLQISLSRLVGSESIIFKIILLVLAAIFSPLLRKDADTEDTDEEKDEEGDREEKSEKAVVKEYSSYADSSEDKEIEESEDDGDDFGHEFSHAEASADKEGVMPINYDKALFSWPRSNIQINYPLSLLKNKPQRPTSGNIDRNQDIIKRTLNDFGIPCTMGEVRIGPTVTQYTFKPAKGIGVSRVKTLSEDLALELALHPVRIEAPIPGKSLVGLEVPNETKVLVSLKEIIQSKKFKNRSSNTMIALGRDVTGNIWLDDLAKLPHLLIAGATNSGKSIFLHSLITSLLYQNNPDDLKLILIDVKQVELAPYNGLPYLIAPVITESKRAIRALQWCLGEMDRRLEVLSQAKCQNIQDYNKRRVRMPYLVVVVDELGDIMSLNKKEAEAAIIRLGQKARAAGIHLVLAMQRPSVDILSGLIKANMPGRISFQVTSSINSRTILDFTGAEKLIGRGDMLFINAGMPKPVRIQGSYISSHEVNAVVKYAKRKAGKAKYVAEITELKTGQLNMDDFEELDEGLLAQAKDIIFEYNKASATMLQSRLAIGYPRANRILDILEKQGIVGPSIQNKPREVLRGR